MKSLYIVHLELEHANRLVKELHRHHGIVLSHRFSIGVCDNNRQLCGAAIVGRPVSRAIDYTEVLEVTRLVTDGTPHACSALYGACARIGKELGYIEIQTYILSTELGTSLKAAGWSLKYFTTGGCWPDRGYKSNEHIQLTIPKQCWSKILNPVRYKLASPPIKLSHAIMPQIKHNTKKIFTVLTDEFTI